MISWQPPHPGGQPTQELHWAETAIPQAHQQYGNSDETSFITDFSMIGYVENQEEEGHINIERELLRSSMPVHYTPTQMWKLQAMQQDRVQQLNKEKE